MVCCPLQALAVDSFDDIRKAAEQGDAGAQFSLGLMYSNGEGVTKDFKEAVKFATAAAALSCTKLGAQPSIPTLDEINNFIATHNS